MRVAIIFTALFWAGVTLLFMHGCGGPRQASAEQTGVRSLEPGSTLRKFQDGGTTCYVYLGYGISCVAPR